MSERQTVTIDVTAEDIAAEGNLVRATRRALRRAMPLFPDSQVGTDNVVLVTGWTARDLTLTLHRHGWGPWVRPLPNEVRDRLRLHQDASPFSFELTFLSQEEMDSEVEREGLIGPGPYELTIAQLFACKNELPKDVRDSMAGLF